MLRVPRALLCSRLPPPIPPPYPKPSPNPFPPLLLLRRPVEWLIEAMAGSSKLESLWLGRAIVLQCQRGMIPLLQLTQTKIRERPWPPEDLGHDSDFLSGAALSWYM